MKWIYYVQLLSYSQDDSVLDLLRFPGPPLQPPEIHLRAILWSRGKTKSQHAENPDLLISAMRSETANELKLSYRFPQWQVPKSQIVITRITNLMSVSPNSSFWASALDYEAPTTAARRIQRNHQGKETGLKWHGITNYPTLMESIIELKSSLPGEELIVELYEATVSSFPDALVRAGVSGGAELGTSIIALNMLEEVARFPLAVQELDTRFDRLHEILLGPPESCLELGRMLGPEVVTRIITSSAGSIVMLHIPERLINPTTTASAAAWLISRSGPPAEKYAPNEDDGEFECGTGVIFTYRRHLELTRNGFLSPPDSYKDYFHFVRPRYCEKLGWDPDDMVVMHWDREAIKRFDAEVDLLFEELIHIDSLSERIWLAHRDVLRHLWAKHVVDFVEQRYFAVPDTLM